MSDAAGAILLEAGIVSQADLATAAASRKARGGTLGLHLVELGAIDDEKLADFFHQRLLVPRLTRTALAKIRPDALHRLPYDMAAEFRVVPVDLDRENNLTLAMADPADTHAVEEVSFFTGHYIIRAVASESDIAWALAHHYGIGASAPSDAAGAPVVAAPPAPPVAPQPAGIGAVSAESQHARSVPPDAAGPSSQHRNVQAPAEPRTPAAPVAPTAAAPHESGSPGLAATPVEPAAPPATHVAPTPLPPVHATPARPAEPVLLTKVRRKNPTSIIVLDKPKQKQAARRARNERRKTMAQVSGGSSQPAKAPAPAAATPAAAAATQAVLLFEGLDHVRTAPDRDGATRAVLELLGSAYRRTLFFAIAKGRIVCQCAHGVSNEVALRALSIPLEAPSIWREVAQTGRIHQGPLPEGPLTALLLAALGERPPEIVLVPVQVRKRVVGFLYGDFATTPLPHETLLRLAAEAGAAYERIMEATKRGRA